MSQLMVLTMSLLSSMLFSMMKHPMAMGVMLLIQTVLISLFTNSISQTSWFSYILFLVFLGGMMVLFIYMTSVASNEMFKKNKNYIYVFMILAGMIFIDPMMFYNNTIDAMEALQSMAPQTSKSMFNYPNMIMTLFSVLYLFLTLIIVVFMTKSQDGALRSKN